ncbi:hypothetical protein LEP3755_14200 [Leptolyngbya sp. NIES-3755]|nr:hypothetical protein LEP3755_14200 [Leptolyngbya sp. NIES-3755]
MLISKWLKGTLLAGISTGVVSYAVPSIAAERVILTYGFFQETFSIQDMQTFVETGQLAPVRQFQLRLAGADPEALRSFLNQEVNVNFLTLDRTLNSLPGEFLLQQLGQVIYNRRRVAPIQSLRSAIVLSAKDDNTVSMLQFLQNYPLPEVFFDGRQIARTSQKVSTVRETARNQLQTITSMMQQVLGEPLCRCDSETITTEKP